MAMQPHRVLYHHLLARSDCAGKSGKRRGMAGQIARSIAQIMTLTARPPTILTADRCLKS
jgi:hypothetical protein